MSNGRKRKSAGAKLFNYFSGIFSATSRKRFPQNGDFAPDCMRRSDLPDPRFVPEKGNSYKKREG